MEIRPRDADSNGFVAGLIINIGIAIERWGCCARNSFGPTGRECEESSLRRYGGLERVCLVTANTTSFDASSLSSTQLLVPHRSGNSPMSKKYKPASPSRVLSMLDGLRPLRTNYAKRLVSCQKNFLLLLSSCLWITLEIFRNASQLLVKPFDCISPLGIPRRAFFVSSV